MFYKIKNTIHKKWFNFKCRDILKSKPIQCDIGSGTTIVTQLRHEDVIMYISAIKSFFLYLKEAKVFVLNDGTLTNMDIDLLKKNIVGVKVIPICDVENQKCPSEGCWERLLFVSDLVRDGYVLQIDSDIIFNGDIDEVINDVKENKSFLISGDQGGEFKSLAESSKNAEKSDSTFVQIVAEKAMINLENAKKVQYSRGCAAFSGFGKGSFSRSDVEKFSVQMEKLLGKEKWSEWGSEQVTSNFIIANSEKKMILPWPKYANYWPKEDMQFEKSSVIHFIGTNRFKNGLYIKLAINVIKQLQGK